MDGVMRGAILAVIALGLVLVIWQVWRQGRRLSLAVRGEALAPQDLERQLQHLHAMVDLQDPFARRLAVMEAYKLFDTALKTMRFSGARMRDRLLRAMEHEPRLETMRPVYELAHRLHASSRAEVTEVQARGAVAHCREALRLLHLL